MLNETPHSCITGNAFNKDTAKHERPKTGLPIIYCNNTIPNIANEKFCSYEANITYQILLCLNYIRRASDNEIDFRKCTINDYAS